MAQTRVRSVDEGPSSGISMVGDETVDLRDWALGAADDFCDVRDAVLVKVVVVDFRVFTRPGISEFDDQVEFGFGSVG